MAMYVTCPYCGDNLDPGEQCACREQDKKDEDAEEETNKGRSTYKIYDFEDEKAWLKGRLHGIGGSDASAVVGKNPYKTNIELFEEKTGRKMTSDISEKPYVIYGKEAEQYIRDLFRLDYPQYQVQHYEYRILQNLEHPFMQASLDGELFDQDGRKGILEIKTTNILQSMQCEKWGADVRTQVKHYFIERAEVEEDLNYLLDEEIKFWKYVESGRKPPLILPEI